MGPAEVKLRLYSRLGTNDPHEHKMADHGADKTEEKRPKNGTPKFRISFPDDVFMWCGSKPQTGEDGEIPNRLEMWRAYGDDGRGVAFTTWWNVRQLELEGLEIVEVEYLADLSSLKEDMDKLIDKQGDGTRNRREREEIRRKRMMLGASHKLCDYESEREVRLVYCRGDESGSVRQQIHFEVPDGRLRSYIERPVKLGTTLTGLDITLGPRMSPSDASHWQKVGEWMLGQMGVSGGRVDQSQLRYLG